jgi:ABC-type uncharacterized transport system substrate-binding protein
MPQKGPGFKIISVVLLSLVIWLHWITAVESAENYQTAPTSRKGEKWRIGYCEGGPYVNYPANLIAIARGLAQLGWMDAPKDLDRKDPADAKGVWLALAQTHSDYLRFVPDAFYSANWDNHRRVQNRKAVISRLQGHQLDLMIAMGTWAGQDLANDLHSVPTMVVSSSDPVKSGIVKSAIRSGYNHVHARCVPHRYFRQVLLFHDIVGFKRLGMVYENSVAGKSYAGLSDIEQAATLLGFELVKCEAPWSGVSREVSTDRMIECHKRLAPRIDALYITVHQGVDDQRMDEILAPLMAYKIPTWSQRGPQEVRRGVLMSIGRGDFKAVGRYHAGIMAKIFNGASPGKLSQIFQDPKKISINLKTADRIGFKAPKGLLQAADEIYEK